MVNLYVEDGYADPFYTQEGITAIWGNREVFVPRSALLLIQSYPVEIRQLDLTEFRLSLHGLQESEAGMCYPHIHTHNFAVTVAGVTLAQVVEIVNGYTITFEDGLYNVNIVGGNSNVADRVNKNQVGVNTSNSAGLQDSTSLQAASFGDGAVALSLEYGTPGTTFPIGTRGTPSSNWADATAISGTRNLDGVLVLGMATLAPGDDVSNLRVIGSNPLTSILAVHPESNTLNVLIENVYFTGALDGGSTLVDCVIGEVQYFDGYIRNCALAGDNIYVNGTATLFDCAEAAKILNKPTIDMVNGDNLFVRRYSGDLIIANKTTEGLIEIELNGELTIEASCTSGNFRIFGDGHVINNSSLVIEDMTTGTPTQIADSVWSSVTRELTNTPGLTQEEHDKLFSLANYDDTTISGLVQSIIDDLANGVSVDNIDEIESKFANLRIIL